MTTPVVRRQTFGRGWEVSVLQMGAAGRSLELLEAAEDATEERQ